MQMNIIRQGDVLLAKVGKLPAGAVEQKPDGARVVLAYGEVTGHAHAIYEPTKAKLWSAGAERFLQVLEKAALQHEEHATAYLEPGIYRLPAQVEYTPAELRRVAD
jgi:hypothetical protein